MAEVILEICAARYAYPGAEQAASQCEGHRSLALDGADLSVRRRTRLALLGGNGAGKTTLLLHLNGILRPTSGSVRFRGEPADYSREGIRRWRQQVGLVFQHADDQIFAASVLQDVSYGPLNLGLSEQEARERVEEALCALGIPELAESPTHMLSFGQKKRVAIAGVLAMRPEIVILDEPTAGLDPSGVEQLMATLEDLRRSGTTTVICTHDVDLAFSWADEVAILAGGRVLRQGAAADVMGDAQLMQRAHLRVPWVLEMTSHLATTGHVPAVSPPPRTFAELRALVGPRCGLGEPADAGPS